MLNATKRKTPTIGSADRRRIVNIVYTNYRGETAQRRIIPQRVWFGATQWHREEQWLLDAFDLDRESPRSFALCDIKSYSP